MVRLASTINVTAAHAADAGRLARAARAVHVHHDVDHARAVITLLGPAPALLAALRRIALEALQRPPDRIGTIGVHPTTGTLDVVPVIPLEGASRRTAGRVARAFAAWLGDQGIPVHPTGWPDHPRRADHRRIGPDGAPAVHHATPLAGPLRPHPRHGVTLVSVRPWLVPFNVWLTTDDLDHANALARHVRKLEGVEALGLPLPTRGRTMVSMNLTRPRLQPPHRVVRHLDDHAQRLGATLDRGEVAGAVPAWLDVITDWAAARTPRPTVLPPPPP